MFKQKVSVVDAICGKGKTEWAIKYMNENKHIKNFIFVTPYLNEVERIIEKCGFSSPKDEDGKKKIDDLENLIDIGESIATTHKLFTHITPRIVEKIKNSNYELILDEVIDVVSESSLKEGDKKALIDIGLLKEVDGELIRGEEEKIQSYPDGDWAYSGIVNGLKRKNLEIFENKILMWLFPIDIFNSFKRIWILTFMFDGYGLSPYFKLNGIEYEKFQIENGNICKYKLDDVSYLKDLITINNETKLNDIGDVKGAFTLYWYDKLSDESILIIRNNIKNFCSNKCKAKINDILWTTFKENLDTILTPYTKSKNFLSHNTRATNNYIDKHILLYLVNRNYNPIVKRWFTHKNIEINQDIYALAEMIQWVFRSAIRNKNPITIYCPSSRMRQLFITWINGDLQF